MNHYLYFFLFILLLELITAVTATVYRNAYRYSKEKYFFYFLWYTFLSDLIGILVAYFTDKANHFIYNLYMTVAFLFFLFWYRSILKKRKVINALLVIYGVLATLSLLNQGFFNNFQSINFVSGAVVITVCALIYFAETLQSDTVILVHKTFTFWVTIGILLFHIGIIPLMMFKIYLKIQDLSYIIISTFLNIILYTCYIIGFRWMRKK